jgi:hypothetical protein
MPTIAPRGGHNVPVTSHRRARTALITALLAPALLLSGCGSSKDKPSAKPTTDLPTGNVKVPAGITLTKAGAALTFRQPAVVTYEPNTQRSSVLSMSVDSVQAGRLADFAAYQLDDRTKKSRPYYVRYTVKNVGTGDLSRSAVPLLAVDNRNTLIQPSTFNNTFARCPSLPLPAGFGAGKTVRGCLVYLVPNGGTLTEVSFRPLQAFPPITWKGTIVPPAVTKKKADNKTVKKGKKKKKANP